MHPKLWILLLGVLAVASALAVAAPNAEKPSKTLKQDPASAKVPARKPGKQTVLTINGEKVTRDAYETMLQSTYGEAAKDTLIDDVLIRQQKKKHGIQIGEHEIDALIETDVREEFETVRQTLREKYGAGASLDRYYRLYRGTTLAELMKKGRKIRKQRRWEFERVLVLNRLTFYHDLIDEKIAAQFILLGTEKAAQRVLKSLQDGARFSVLAKRESLDFLSRRAGGRLADFRPGDYKFGKGVVSEAFDKAARELKIGKISGIVKTDAGYILLKKLVHFKPKIQPYAKLKDKVDKMIATRRVQEIDRMLCLARIRADAKIEQKKIEQKK